MPLSLFGSTGPQKKTRGFRKREERIDNLCCASAREKKREGTTGRGNLSSLLQGLKREHTETPVGRGSILNIADSVEKNLLQGLRA